jgi:hypothetical protein
MLVGVVGALVVQRFPDLGGHGCAEHVQDLVASVAQPAQSLRGGPHRRRIIFGELRGDDLVERQVQPD